MVTVDYRYFLSVEAFLNTYKYSAPIVLANDTAASGASQRTSGSCGRAKGADRRKCPMLEDVVDEYLASLSLREQGRDSTNANTIMAYRNDLNQACLYL